LNVLFLTYNGLAEPLGQSQILPYLRGLLGKGHRFSVLSFEKAKSETSLSANQVAAMLPPEIQWIRLKYHKWPSVPATLWDVLSGSLRGLLAGPFDLVHARSTVPAAMGSSIASMRRIPWIFDVRGFLAQEYVDAGHWSEAGAVTRIVGRVERRLIDRAEGLVFLSSRGGELAGPAARARAGKHISIIPCAVDMDRFTFDQAERVRIRRELGLLSEPLMVYSGSLGSWYLPSAMLDFFEVARESLKGLHFLVLSPQRELIQEEATARGLSDSLRAYSVPADRVPNYLSAADFGISFIKPAPSKLASSPTKVGEYLSCGLPVIANAGVGDMEALAKPPICFVLPDLSRAEYARAAEALKGRLGQDDLRAECRAHARQHLSLTEAVDRYDKLYSALSRDGGPA
jgi:glycosyltransferase involved in cell wall biosynthesis